MSSCESTKSCKRFYEQKDAKSASDECAACLASSAYMDSSCPCRYDNNGNLCAFAKCVNDAYTTKQQCSASYTNLFNTKHDPFEFKDLKNCEIFSSSSSQKGVVHEGLTLDKNNANNQSFTHWLIWITIAFGVFVWWYTRTRSFQQV